MSPLNYVDLVDKKKRIPIGRCEHCGRRVYSPEDTEYEDYMPYQIEHNFLLHECCLWDYAYKHWLLRS